MSYSAKLNLHDGPRKRDLAVVIHGLAATSNVAHVQGMLKSLFNQGYDTAGLNMPGCGRPVYPSRHRYHFADTEALEDFINRAHDEDRWNNVYLVGFSLGASIIIHYLAGGRVSSLVAGAAAVSAPLSIPEFYARLHEPQNRIYEAAFLAALKLKELMTRGPKILPFLLKAKDLRSFDRIFTLPGTPYPSMDDYERKASALEQLALVKRPLLLLNALDDTFIGAQSYPSEADIHNGLVHTVYLPMGGHCGFKEHLFTDTHLSEEIVAAFFGEQ